MAQKHHHHGGAWKVAYADFVTAMMALFLVLWLTAQDTRIKEAVERAFRNPFSSATKESVGIIPSKDAQAVHKNKGEFDSVSPVEMEMLRRMSEDLAKILQQEDDLNTVKLELTSEGLRIHIFDRSQKPVFEPGSVEFTEYGAWIFSTLAWEISRYRSFRLELEGHTEQGLSTPRDGYDEWELSADRANASRRKLIEHGVVANQVWKVAGYGDTQPMRDQDRTADVNRRVTVLLRVDPANRPPS